MDRSVIIFWNLGIYFCYMLFSKLFMSQAISGKGGNSYEKLFFSIAFPIVCLIIHSITNFILASRNFKNDKKELGKLHLLIEFLVLLIGFPLCQPILLPPK
jgi:hypothetical protein